jgi:hypothetical protein
MAVSHSKLELRAITYSGKPYVIDLDLERCFATQSVIQAIIHYVNSTAFSRLSPSTAFNKVREIRDFILFCENIYSQSNELPFNLLEQYFLFIKKKYPRRNNSNSFRAKIGLIVSVFNSVIKEKSIPLSSTVVSELHRYVEHCPRLNSTPKNPRPSLSELFENCPYSDIQLIESLRLVNSWYLFKLKEQRDYLCNNSLVSLYLERLKSDGMLNSAPYNLFRFSECVRRDTFALKAHGALIKAVLDSDCPLLVERFFVESPIKQSAKNYKEKGYTIDEMKSWISRWLGSGKKCFKSNHQVRQTFVYEPKHRGRKGSYEASFLGLVDCTYQSLVSPTESEIFAMQCFMASERCQLFGLENHNLDNFSLSDSGVQIEFAKDRRAKMSATTIYASNTTPYKVYKYWHGFLSDNQHFIQSKNTTLPFCSPETFRGHFGSTKNRTMEFYTQLEFSGSHLRRVLKEEIVEHAPFLWIFDKIISNNRECRKQDLEYVANRKRKPNLKRSEFVSVKKIGLSVSCIAQSAQRMHPINKVVPKGNPIPKQEDMNVQAELSAHSLKTKLNVYDNRNQSKERIKKLNVFAKQVGDLMEKDALELDKKINDTVFVSFEEVSKLLNLDSPAKNFNELAAQSVDIGLYGEVECDQKKLIILTPITAALMLSLVAQIDKDIIEIKLDSSELYREALLQKFYLEECLERFPAQVRQEGELLVKDYNIPLPSWM